MARILLLALPVLGALACGGQRPADRAEPETSSSGVRVATVNGEAIGSDEVARLCRATGLAPKQALQRLVGARLLAQHARTLGYEERAEVVRATAQARVQQLLAQAVEQGSAPTDVAVRQRKLEVLLAELARRTPITYDEAVIAKVFAGQLP